MKQLMRRGEKKKKNLTLTYKNVPCLDLLAAAPFCQMGEGASARGQPLQLYLSHSERRMSVAADGRLAQRWMNQKVAIFSKRIKNHFVVLSQFVKGRAYLKSVFRCQTNAFGVLLLLVVPVIFQRHKIECETGRKAGAHCS